MATKKTKAKPVKVGEYYRGKPKPRKKKSTAVKTVKVPKAPKVGGGRQGRLF